MLFAWFPAYDLQVLKADQGNTGVPFDKSKVVKEKLKKKIFEVIEWKRKSTLHN